jgi:hypothetical protein
MADVEGPSDFSFNLFLRAGSLRLGLCSAPCLEFPSLLSFAGMPLFWHAADPYGVLWVASQGSHQGRGHVLQTVHARFNVVVGVSVLDVHPVRHLNKLHGEWRGGGVGGGGVTLIVGQENNIPENIPTIKKF